MFIPSLHDIHQDHTTIAQEGVRAFKNTTILGYELIWNNLTFNTQCFITLGEKDVQRKILALKSTNLKDKEIICLLSLYIHWLRLEEYKLAWSMQKLLRSYDYLFKSKHKIVCEVFLASKNFQKPYYCYVGE